MLSPVGTNACVWVLAALWTPHTPGFHLCSGIPADQAHDKHCLQWAEQRRRSTRQWCSCLSGRGRLLLVKLGRQKAVRNAILGWWRLSGKEKAGLNFHTAAMAEPKVALTCTRAQIQAGSLARTGPGVSLVRNTMLAESLRCPMALPLWERRLRLESQLPPQQHISMSSSCPSSASGGRQGRQPPFPLLPFSNPCLSTQPEAARPAYGPVGSLHAHAPHQHLSWGPRAGALSWGVQGMTCRREWH